MMIVEIVGGALFGSLALIADGLHMSTHAGALLLAALAYTFARRYAYDRSFTFGTGKFGDLAGYSSAIVLAMIALLIGYEAIDRFLNPLPIHFREAIPIAVVGLAVNVASAWLLSGGHDHAHGHSHGHGHAHNSHDHDDEPRRIELGGNAYQIEVFEKDVPPRFRIRTATHVLPNASALTIETVRPDGRHQLFSFESRASSWSRATKFPNRMPF
ncbi:MAG: cation transporter [Bradyrhizobium sp.]|nr:cation transporter [Bradyrhizobium sp.]MBV8918697.1 cation transporter [Bradyrhizobium sp.]MBV9985200.1 cation transporter [Bradyrhizobium sp.]